MSWAFPCGSGFSHSLFLFVPQKKEFKQLLQSLTHAVDNINVIIFIQIYPLFNLFKQHTDFLRINP